MKFTFQHAQNVKFVGPIGAITVWASVLEWDMGHDLVFYWRLAQQELGTKCVIHHGHAHFIFFLYAH